MYIKDLKKPVTSNKVVSYVLKKRISFEEMVRLQTEKMHACVVDVVELSECARSEELSTYTIVL